MVMESGYAESVDVASYNRSKSKKIKRPGFMAKWFFKKVIEGMEHEKRDRQEKDAVNKISTLAIGPRTSEIENQERSIQFTVHIANGGRVIETRKYDRQKDRSQTGLYVITNDQDFGKEIDKIITMESLK